VQGQREVMRKLKADELLAGPWADAMRRAGEIGLAAARGAAPVESGLLRAKLTSKMQAKPVPTWVAIRAAATRSSAKYKRYPYPKRVEYDRRSEHRLWMTNAVKGAMGAIQGVLDGAARGIEMKWKA
jgi:hypothetical protein